MENITEFLGQLASQLGVAVEYLWTTLVRQQYAEGITGLIMCSVGLIFLIILAVFATRYTRMANSNYERLVQDRLENGTGYNGSYRVSSFKEDRWNTIRLAVPIVSFIVGFILLCVMVGAIPTAIQQLINPEYFALKEVLDAISGK